MRTDGILSGGMTRPSGARGANGEMTDTSSTHGPNPPCEVGRTHPRDKHRMRPIEEHPGVWECVKHGLYAAIVAKDVADALERGDPYTMHDGQPGQASRTGDERQGGVILYYRAAEA